MLVTATFEEFCDANPGLQRLNWFSVDKSVIAGENVEFITLHICIESR